MRGTVVGVAVLLAAGIAGVGALVVKPFLFPDAKAKPVKVTSEDDRPAPRPGAPRPGKGKVDAPAEAPTRPKRPVGAADTDDDADGTVRRAATSEPGAAAGSRPSRPGAGPGQPGGLLPGADGPPMGTSAAAGGKSITDIFNGPAIVADAGSACPPGMVDIGTFCIDANETTNTQYMAFLAARPSARLQPATCSWNLEYAPTYATPTADTRPVIGVNWCDAWLYCNWAGKRMCGKMGGGNNSPGAFADASRSEWFSVCTNGGVSQFSYGDNFDGTKCAHAGDDGTLAPVGSLPGCVGTSSPYDSVFDMSGNAWEWEDSCSGAAGQNDLCRVRGGGTHASSEIVSCGMDYLAKREATFRTVGIRCCSGRKPGGY